MCTPYLASYAVRRGGAVEEPTVDGVRDKWVTAEAAAGGRGVIQGCCERIDYGDAHATAVDGDSRAARVPGTSAAVPRPAATYTHKDRRPGDRHRRALVRARGARSIVPRARRVTGKNQKRAATRPLPKRRTPAVYGRRAKTRGRACAPPT